MEENEEPQSEEFPQEEYSTTTCTNPFCPDNGIIRVAPIGLGSYWCGTCGVRMLPPEIVEE